MTNGKVEIQLDKLRVLRGDMNAICSIEEQMGEPFSAVLRRLQGEAEIRVVRVLLWAALRSDDKAITLEDAGRFLTWENMPAVTEKLMQAYCVAEEPADASPFANSAGAISVQ